MSLWDSQKLTLMTAADFRFKQFSINHKECAMKVTTDGILLGAWCQLHQAKNVIDIGTGSGLIALMLAQKVEQTSTNCHIVAVELDRQAANQALDNFKQSPWPSTVSLLQGDICQLTQTSLKDEKFDLIVSNPPYFSNSLHSDNESKNHARHNHQLTFDKLLLSAQQLAGEHASLYLILPCNEAQALLLIAERYKWFLSEHVLVSTVKGKVPSRSLLRFNNSKVDKSIIKDIYIRDQNNTYSKAYADICKDYYLKM